MRKGGKNLLRHISNVRKYGVPVIVAVNRFPTDADTEVAAAIEVAKSADCPACEWTLWANGSRGTN